MSSSKPNRDGQLKSPARLLSSVCEARFTLSMHTHWSEVERLCRCLRGDIDALSLQDIDWETEADLREPVVPNPEDGCARCCFVAKQAVFARCSAHKGGKIRRRFNKIVSCAAHYRKRLDARKGTPESLQQATRSRLDQIIEKAGAKRRSDQLLARIDEAFAEVRIVTFPRLTDPYNRPDERIYMFDRDRQMDGLSQARQSFRNQAALRDFILNNRYQFEALRGLSDITAEAKLASGRRLDLLAKRPRRNQLVGIELKLDAADDRAVGQSQHYIDDLVKEAERQRAEPHFMLIAGGQPNKSVRARIESYAKTRGVAVTFLLHRVEMSLRLHP